MKTLAITLLVTVTFASFANTKPAGGYRKSSISATAASLTVSKRVQR